MIKMKNQVIHNVLFMLLIFSVFAVPAAAAVGSSNLKVNMIEINPYPAKIGEYLNLILQVENVGGDKATDVDIAIVPEYPFSLDSEANAVKNIGVLNPGSTTSKEFSLFIDKNAPKGIRTLTVRTRTSKDSPWNENKFDIRIVTEAFNSKSTVELERLVSDPKVFMPRDRGTISITLKNTATTPTVTIGGVTYDTNARIQSAALKSLSDGITVLDSPYQEMGILSPGDCIKLTFNVKVAENAAEGTHNLELAIEGNSFDYNSRNNIPLKVDSSNIKVIPSKALKLVNGTATLEFDVANTHPNEFNSVSIRPEAERVKFYPAEYFIGPMNQGELFTIEFNATADNSSKAKNKNLEPVDLTLSASYSNGVNKHENIVSNLSIQSVEENMSIQSADSQPLLTEVQITKNTSLQEYPAIYGDRIVWQDSRNGNFDIYMYDLSTKKETQITNSESVEERPAIYDDRIVWGDNRNGRYDIYMYDISTKKETQITTNKYDQYFPAIYGDRIVWTDLRNGNRDIYMYDISTKKETQITTDVSNQFYPAIYSDIIVWADGRNGGGFLEYRNRESNWDIYMYDLSTHKETQVTSNKSYQVDPAIYGDRIVWTDNRNGNLDIYMYNLSTSTETQVTTNESDQYYPAIYGDWIVCNDYLNNKLDIRMYDLSGSKEIQITADKYCQYFPAIYGDVIVWQDERNGNPDIYLCTILGEKTELNISNENFYIVSTSRDTTLSVPKESTSTPGFEIIYGIIGLLGVSLSRKSL